MKKINVLLLTILAILIPLQQLLAQKEKGIAIIGFYNLENLFDTENDPTINDEQFLPDGDYRWTPERYIKKLNDMAHVLSIIGSKYGGLAVVGLCELENRRVLEDMIATDHLKDRNWDIVHYDSPDARGIDVALLYDKTRLEVIDSKSYRLTVPNKPNYRTRDQLYVVGVLDQIDTLHFIVNHWPSKIGGRRSIAGRNAAAQLTRSIADSVMRFNPLAKVIVMGDFNDDPDSKSMLTYLKTKTKIEDTQPADIYNPMYEMYRKGIGSYAYRDNWSLIDQIMVSYGVLNPNKNTFKFISAHVYTDPMIMMKTATGSFEDYPYRTYAGGAYQGGYSDHYPVYIILKK